MRNILFLVLVCIFNSQAMAQFDSGEMDPDLSTIVAAAPSNTNTNDGTVVVVLKDYDGNPLVREIVTVSFTPQAGSCSGSCGVTNSLGSASCIFSCTDSGIVEIGVFQPEGFNKAVNIIIP